MGKVGPTGTSLESGSGALTIRDTASGINDLEALLDPRRGWR
jgi:hypothetical protein